MEDFNSIIERRMKNLQINRQGPGLLEQIKAETFPGWLSNQLKKFLKTQDVNSTVEYILSIDSEEDCLEYLTSILEPSEKTEQFIDSFFEKRREYGPRKLEIPDDVQIYRKETDVLTQESKPKAPKKKATSLVVKKVKIEPKKVKPHGICNCQATEHPLFMNCLNCGKILCEIESGSECTFCGVDTGRNSNNINSESLKKAIAHKNKLLEFERTSAQRTTVIDDQADYYSMNNWISPEERENLRKREHEIRVSKEQDKRKVKLSFDFAGRKIFLNEDENGNSLFEVPEELSSNNDAWNTRLFSNPFVNSTPVFTPIKEKKEPKPNLNAPKTFSKRIQYDYFDPFNFEQNEKVSDLPSFKIKGIIEENSRNWTDIERESLLKLMKQKSINSYLFFLEKENQGDFEKIHKLCKNHSITFNLGLSLSGDESTLPKFEKKIREANQKGITHLTIDLTEFIPSSTESLSELHTKVLLQILSNFVGVQFYVIPAFSDSNLEDLEVMDTIKIDYWKHLSQLENNFSLLFNISESASSQFAENVKSLFPNKNLIFLEIFPNEESSESLLYSKAYQCKSKDIIETVEGIFFKPLGQSIEKSLFSLSTAFDYLNAPEIYNPERSLGAALTELLEDERIASDVYHLLTYLNQPKTRFHSIWARKLQSKQFFLELQERIKHVKNSSLPQLMKTLFHPVLQCLEEFCQKSLEQLEKKHSTVKQTKVAKLKSKKK